MKYSGSVIKDNVILRIVISKYINEKYKLKSLKRESIPESGSTLF